MQYIQKQGWTERLEDSAYAHECSKLAYVCERCLELNIIVAEASFFCFCFSPW